MPRSTWKPFLISKKYSVPSEYDTVVDSQPSFLSFSRVDTSYGAKTPKGTKTPYERSTRVVSQYVGETFGISTGKTKVQVLITDDMIGKKLGEFALTRKLTQHTKKTKKKKR